MPGNKAEMKKWAKEHIKGVENTLFPSFDPGLKELDEAGIRLDVRQSIRHGFTSMMCATETGLTLDEARRFLEIAADEAGDDIIVTTSVILNSFEENMELVESAEKAGRHLKRVALELGGHNPLVILKDADIDYAVNAATFGAFLHQGQICMSVRRIIIESEIAGEFTESL